MEEEMALEFLGCRQLPIEDLSVYRNVSQLRFWQAILLKLKDSFSPSLSHLRKCLILRPVFQNVEN